MPDIKPATRKKMVDRVAYKNIESSYNKMKRHLEKRHQQTGKKHIYKISLMYLDS